MLLLLLLLLLLMLLLQFGSVNPETSLIRVGSVQSSSAGTSLNRRMSCQ